MIALEGADPIDRWAVDSTCSEELEGRTGWSQCVRHL